MPRSCDGRDGREKHEAPPIIPIKDLGTALKNLEIEMDELKIVDCRVNSSSPIYGMAVLGEAPEWATHYQSSGALGKNRRFVAVHYYQMKSRRAQNDLLGRVRPRDMLMYPEDAMAQPEA